MMFCQSMPNYRNRNIACQRHCDMSLGDHFDMGETLGQRLRRLREAKEWSQVKLAKEANCGQSTVSMLENDQRTKRPDLLSIADALGVDVYYLRDGVRRISPSDARVDEIVSLLRGMSEIGKAIVLDKARDVAKEHDISVIATRKASGE